MKTKKKIRGHGECSVRLRHGSWRVRISTGSSRREIAVKAKTRKEALAEAATLRVDIAAGRYDPDAAQTRVRDLYADMNADYEANGRRLKDLEKRWSHLDPIFGGDRAQQVTTARLRLYVTERMEKGAKPATVQRELACLRRMFRLGYQAEKVVRVPHFPTIRVNNVRKGFFERTEFNALYAELPEHLQPPAMVGYWMGWRRSEVLNLQWRQVNLESGEVRLDPGSTKNRDGRVGYLPEEALAVLRQWRARTAEIERREGRIIPNVFHRRGKPIRDFYTAWRDACDRAKVPGKMFHDFRRTAARNYVRAGVCERVAQAVLGHKTRSVFDRYNIVAEGDLREAAKRVESVTSGAVLGRIAPNAQAANENQSPK